MAFDPRSIMKGIKNSPRKIVIYGPPKIGKSSLVSAIPGALMIPTEDRVTHIDCDKTDVVGSYEEVMEIFQYLYSGTSYRAVIVDTLDWMEPMLHESICRARGFDSIIDNRNPETNYGRGLKYHAVEGWKKFLYNCDHLRKETGMSIILVAHSQVEKISPPESDAYDRYSFKIDKNATAVVEEWADVIGFYNREVLVSKEDQGFGKKKGKALNIDDRRVLNLQATSPAWISGNSFDLPDCVVTMKDAPAIMAMILNQEEKAKTTKSKKGA